MRRLVGLGSLAAALMLPLGSAGAQTQVIGFEDLGPVGIPASYAGLTWSTGWNFWAVAAAGSSVYRPSSGGANAYTGESTVIWFSRPGEAFDLNSIFLSEILAPERTELAFWITGSRDGVGVYSTELTLDRTSMVKYDLNWTNVDQVMMGPIKGSLLIDDITITSTPEPATMLLVGSGLAGVFGAARRRKNAKAAQA